MPVNFANPQQRKFYLIMRAFKIGNILGTITIALYAGKHFLGV
ncbi:MAG TPA: hypothetical protein VGR54_03625 [Nitrosopumilaceae archaeon]|nr:hypothetical protein [Nitrosopumilaceae archaeon]